MFRHIPSQANAPHTLVQEGQVSVESCWSLHRIHEPRCLASLHGKSLSRDSVNAVLDASAKSARLYGHGLGMIASENIISPNVKRAINSIFTEICRRLPGKRYYQGCDDFDTIEDIGINLAKKVFQANFANIQSTSGTVSNIGALKALAKPGDAITAVSTADGGHISHARMGAVGLRDLNVSTYPWDEDRWNPMSMLHVLSFERYSPNYTGRTIGVSVPYTVERISRCSA